MPNYLVTIELDYLSPEPEDEEQPTHEYYCIGAGSLLEAEEEAAERFYEQFPEEIEIGTITTFKIGERY